MAYSYIPTGHLWHHTGLNLYCKVNPKASIQYGSGGYMAENGCTGPKSKLLSCAQVCCKHHVWLIGVAQVWLVSLSVVLPVLFAERESTHCQCHLLRGKAGITRVICQERKAHGMENDKKWTWIQDGGYKLEDIHAHYLLTSSRFCIVRWPQGCQWV